MIIGIAGYMGSGKSTLAKMICEEFDATLLDADIIARTIMTEDSSIIESVSKVFDVVEDGCINFQELGKIVFSDPQSLDMLNDIVHPILIKELNSKASQESSPVLIDAALLTFWGERITLDQGIWIDASVGIRTERIMTRTGLRKEVASERISSQMNLFSPASSEIWDQIQNNEDINSTYQHVRQLISKWL